MTKARDLSQIPNASLGMKNRIINGDCRIDQRNAGAAVTTTGTGIYFVDRWTGFRNNAGWSVQQVTDAPVGFVNSLRVTTTTANAGSIALVQQFFEGNNVADFGLGTANAATFTLSFWVKSSVTGTFAVNFGNGATNRSYVTTYVINSANTWEYKTITITGDTTGTWATNNTAGLRVLFNLGTGGGSTTAGSWQAGDLIRTSGSIGIEGTLNATWQLTGVQLEKGSTATSFDYRPYGTELALCQRYYYLHASSNSSPIGTGFYYTASQIRGHVFYKQPMRTSPTAVISTGTSFYYLGANGSNDLFDALSINENSVNGCEIFSSAGAVTGTAGVAGVLVCQNASSSVAFSAEL
jgi:hypothetical protein